MNKPQLEKQLTKRLRRTGAPNARTINNAMDIVSRYPVPFTNTMLPSAPSASSASSPSNAQFPKQLQLRRIKSVYTKILNNLLHKHIRTIYYIIQINILQLKIISNILLYLILLHYLLRILSFQINLLQKDYLIKMIL